MSLRQHRSPIVSRSHRMHAGRAGRGARPPFGVLQALESRVLMAVDPVIVYNFNEAPGSTTVEDASVENVDNDGTLAGTIIPTFESTDPSPAGGNFLRLSGDNRVNGPGGRVDTAQRLDPILGGTGSLAFYVRTAGVGQTQAWDSGGVTGAEDSTGGRDIFWGNLDTQGRMRLQTGDATGAVATTAIINNSTWQQVIQTRDSATGFLRSYTNGALTTQATGDLGQKAALFDAIGAVTRVDGNDPELDAKIGYNYFGGDLDQVEVYDRALPPREVGTRYGPNAASAPATPSPATATPAARTITLNFTEPAGALGYEILRASAVGGPYTSLGFVGVTSAGTSLAYTDTGLTPDTNYFYRIIAYNKAGDSAPAQINTATTGFVAAPGAVIHGYNDGFWGQGNGNRQTPLTLTPNMSPNFEGNIGDVNENFDANPLPGIRADDFSTVTTGKVRTNAAGQYSFLGFGDDDTIVFVNGVLTSYDPNGHGVRDPRLVSQGGGQPDGNSFNGFNGGAFPITLAADTEYNFSVFQAEQGGGAGVQLQWIQPGQTAPALVPADRLMSLPDRPAAPSPLTATPFSQQVTLNWGDVSTSELIYRVFRGGTLIATLPLNATSYTDTGLTPNTAYQYMVVGVNYEGEGFSASVNTMTITDEPIPTAPSALVARAYLTTTNRLTFLDNSTNETGFRVERRTIGGTFAPVTGSPAPARAGTGGTVVFDDASAAAGVAYEYRVTAVNTENELSPFSNIATVTTGAPGGTGLRELIFDSINATTQEPDVAATVNQVDAQVGDLDDQFDVAPNGGRPHPSIGPDTFANLWAGKIRVLQTGNYTFTTLTDDGVRLFINGVAVINDYVDQAPEFNTTAPINLVAGTDYDIRMEYYEDGGGAIAQLFWENAALGIPRELVPQVNLFPAPEDFSNLSTPANVEAVNLCDDRVFVVFTDPGSFGEIGYTVQRAEGNGEFFTVGNLQPGQGTFVDFGPFTLGTTYRYQVRTDGPANSSAFSTPVSVTVTENSNDILVPAFTGGASTMFLNGSTVIDGSRLRLTDNVNDETGSAYFRTPVKINGDFLASFDFEVSDSNGADGFTFVLQSNSPRMLGGGGGGLGYAGTMQQNSIAYKFDFFADMQPTFNQTGAYLSGGMDDLGVNINPAAPPDGTGIDIDNGDVYRVTLAYEAALSKSTLTITDAADPTQTFSTEFFLDIFSALGTDCAFAGFTGATGGLNAQQDIINFSFDGPGGQTLPLVVDRHVFYNASFFDGSTGQVPDGPNDDAAVAPNKDPLLPGGTATEANYTSYTRGINGIMVDIANLPASTLAAGDFEFRVGNDNNPAGWALAPAPTSITVRDGAGVNGSDRVTIKWANGAISKTWLQVRVKNNANTGLNAPDVFYFGNAPGDTFNSAAGAIFTVNSLDVQRTRINQFGDASSLTNPASLFDHDKSGGVVNAIDLQQSRINQFTNLNRISVPIAVMASARVGSGGAVLTRIGGAPITFASVRGAWASLQDK